MLCFHFQMFVYYQIIAASSILWFCKKKKKIKKDNTMFLSPAVLSEEFFVTVLSVETPVSDSVDSTTGLRHNCLFTDDSFGVSVTYSKNVPFVITVHQNHGGILWFQRLWHGERGVKLMSGGTKFSGWVKTAFFCEYIYFLTARILPQRPFRMIVTYLIMTLSPVDD